MYKLFITWFGKETYGYLVIYMVKFTFKIRCAGSKVECEHIKKKLKTYIPNVEDRVGQIYEHEGTIEKPSYLEARRYAHKIQQDCPGMISAIDFIAT